MNLNKIRVLVTRPKPQSEALIAAIRAANGIAIPFPAITIDTSDRIHEAAHEIASLGERDGPDLLIFVSTNSVQRALELFPPQGMAAQPAIGAIGRATAAELEASGLSVDHCPEGRADSMAFLALPAMQRVTGKQVLIVRGNGGLPLLGDTLSERGASVRYAEVYQRRLPMVPPGRFPRLCADPGIDVTMATSVEALDNLCTLAGDQGRAQLLGLPIIVASERIAAVARKAGFKADILTAKGADDASMLAALLAALATISMA